MDSYAAVHQGDRLLLLRDRRPPPRKLAEDLAPQPRDLEILRALWRHRFLLTSQIASEWWPGKSLYAAQRRLLRMTAAGWIDRFRPRLSKGKHEWIYELARAGFELGRICWTVDGPCISPEAKWKPRHVTDYRLVQHDLQVNAWVMAYRRLAGDRVVDWIGPDHGRIDVPTKYVDRRFKQVELEDAHHAMTDYTRPRDLRLSRFAPLVPDATVTLDSDAIDSELDLLIELDRTRRPTKNIDKLHRYDAFLTGWWSLTDRYGHLPQPPVLIFVCPDEDQAISLMRTADREVTGRHARPGAAVETWSSPGRERMLFVAEPDVHDSLGRAWALPRRALSERDSEDIWARETELPPFL
jgi:Replication-relaxation